MPRAGAGRAAFRVEDGSPGRPAAMRVGTAPDSTRCAPRRSFGPRESAKRARPSRAPAASPRPPEWRPTPASPMVAFAGRFRGRPHRLHRCAGPRPGAGLPSVSSASAGSLMGPEARTPPRQRSWSRSASPSARGSRRSPTRRCGVRTAEGGHGLRSAEGTARVARAAPGIASAARPTRRRDSFPGRVGPRRRRRLPEDRSGPRIRFRSSRSGEKRPGCRARLLRSR